MQWAVSPRGLTIGVAAAVAISFISQTNSALAAKQPVKAEGSKAAKTAEVKKVSDSISSTQAAPEEAGVLGATSSVTSEEATGESKAFRFIKQNFGMNYNSFFAGPGLNFANDRPVAFTGRASDAGFNFFNLISVRWKFSQNIAFDVQFRNQLVVNNVFEYRHQGQRFGVSGKLLSGTNWRLTGAVNTDLPIRGIMGQIASERTLITNPGMFASYSYTPSDSRWSVFALVTPRLFFYSDRQAVSSQDVVSNPSNPQARKPEYVLVLNPSINYAVNDKTGIRFGTTLDYRKNVGFDAIRRDFMPFELGVTYDVSPAFSVYTYVMTSTPLDDQLRKDLARGGPTVPWYQTASLNVWLSGTLF
jgi:hypothetical protein